jgi:hypothetical protein
MKEEKAFRRVVDICLAEMGDSIKNDLINIGIQLNEDDDAALQETFPELYSSDDDLVEEIEEDDDGTDEDDSIDRDDLT